MMSCVCNNVSINKLHLLSLALSAFSLEYKINYQLRGKQYPYSYTLVFTHRPNRCLANPQNRTKNCLAVVSNFFFFFLGESLICLFISLFTTKNSVIRSHRSDLIIFSFENYPYKSFHRLRRNKVQVSVICLCPKVIILSRMLCTADRKVYKEQYTLKSTEK